MQKNKGTMTGINNADDRYFGIGDFNEDILCWSPSCSSITQMDKFRHAINKKYNLKLETYEELWQWSVKEYDHFWKEVWDFSGMTYSRPFAVVVDKSKSITEIPKWFVGARLNYAENLLRDNSDRIALYSTGERICGEPKKCTFGELRQRVAQFAAAMRAMGVKYNDRVVGYIPNCAEAIVAMLAAASIGAVWSSTSPDFGVHGVLDRFTQIQPKLIFSVDAVVYNGKVHNHMDKLLSVVSGLPELEKVVVIHFAGEKQDVSIIPKSLYLDQFLLEGINADGSIPNLTFEQLPFNHPLFIMYSSGTTGVPKCMVHSAGGTLLQLWKEHVLGGNMTDKDILLYYTTTGWMMWNWMVSALAIGASLVLYDGSPLVPSPYVLWDLIEQLNITILGTSAKWIALLEDKKVHPKQTHNLSSLHSILSTGSPLKPRSFDYVYEHIKEDVLLGSITGGTDIISCFAGWNWTVPVYRGEIQCRNLGMAVECYDHSGKPVYGGRGDLVCTKPFPSMPTHFWNDPTGSRYRKAYFETFPGVWTHGDFCLINKRTGGLWMLGRSDGTLNPSGVRFGSSEIYNIVESYKEIDDSLCVGQQNDNGEERVILFVKMTAGHPFTQDLVTRLKAGIRTELSARHVPSLILVTKDIPYTTNSKKVEVAVKQMISGLEVQNKGALANPDSLELYRNVPELQNW